MALGTVAELVATARVLLMDTIEPYRYLDDQLVTGLNLGLLEARRIRPDLFMWSPNDTPAYTAVDATPVDIDQQYRSAILYYVVGHAQLRDEEDTSDVRSATLMNSFMLQLLTLPTQVGVPGAA